MTDEPFEINSYEIEDIQSGMNNMNKEIATISETSKKEFASYKHSETLGKGINKVNEQLDEISDSLMMMSNTIQKGTDSLFETESKLLEEIKSIEIPKDFETIDMI